MTDQSRSSLMTRRAVLGLGALGAVGVAAGGWVMLSRPSFAGQALSVSEAHKSATGGQIFLIDIRRPDEWQKTGVGEGAHPIDMRRKDFVSALDQVTGGDKAAPVALICARGVRSARMSNMLTEAGYTNIIDVPEGMLGSSAGPGWLQTGLPVRDVEG
ncbi:rhodanese-like domain-containing protein [Roseovarius phycicola]|uniref:Rhodanese-like domain-containing protein n=2 Tax=Roseovarius TaxID=74030 RepID=A0ABZ2HHE6_9RHOB